MILHDLDKPCLACQRPAGDHTLREWNACMGVTTTDAPFEPTPPDLAQAAADGLRKRFALDDDLLIADHVVVRAITLAGNTGALDIRLPALLTDFQIGLPDQPPQTIAKVLFVGNVDSVRGYGRLVRDSANGAANAASAR